ncbi:hypothetical protein [Methanosarcina sp. UBA5]|uniref:hypothetical protein n=1 Tax=Methanosarcina sp. UBA5 TaxID=1915593 RepID=UPI0025DA6DB6|nr:hypothetical protein [Methanosarcina sp. UBA5]
MDEKLKIAGGFAALTIVRNYIIKNYKNLHRFIRIVAWKLGTQIGAFLLFLKFDRSCAESSVNSKLLYTLASP